MALALALGVTNSCVTNNQQINVVLSVTNNTGSSIKANYIQPYVSRVGNTTGSNGGQAQDSAAAYQPGNNIPTAFAAGNASVVIPANSTINFSWGEVFHGQIGGTATTGQGSKYFYDCFAVVNGDDNSVNVSNRATVNVIPEDTYTGSQNSVTNLQNAQSPFNMPVAGQLRFESNLLSGNLNFIIPGF